MEISPFDDQEVALRGGFPIFGSYYDFKAGQIGLTQFLYSIGLTPSYTKGES